MDLYTQTSYELSRALTLRYSTSFSASTELFDKSIRAHIFAIYGLVRIADEIVDTYDGSDKKKRLDDIESETYAAIQSGYSTNPIVHSFAQTARIFAISDSLIKPFFASMRMDLTPQHYTEKTYKKYIYGSAEVIGLMCLRVFTGGNDKEYDLLAQGAMALGAAYQKVNFLRDIASDFNDRQRVYFPGVSFDSFTDQVKNTIIIDIERDFKKGYASIVNLPPTARRAVELSYNYYYELLKKLRLTPAATLKQQRVRVSNFRKLILRFAALKPLAKRAG